MLALWRELERRMVTPMSQLAEEDALERGSLEVT
jgi:hypothetical protein